MASACGEGLLITVGATYSISTPLTIADFRPQSITGNAPDGLSCNVFTINNTDTANFFAVRIPGLNTNSTASYFAIPPSSSQPFQLGLIANDLQLIQGWAIGPTLGTPTGAIVISAGVTVRRGG